MSDNAKTGKMIYAVSFDDRNDLSRDDARFISGLGTIDTSLVTLVSRAHEAATEKFLAANADAFELKFDCVERAESEQGRLSREFIATFNTEIALRVKSRRDSEERQIEYLASRTDEDHLMISVVEITERDSSAN